MSEKTQYKGLTGWVLVEDGMVSGSGESFVQYCQDQRRAEAQASARVKAGLPPHTVTSTAGLFQPVVLLCVACKQSSVSTTGGLCDKCGDGMVTAALPTIACPNCSGSGQVEIPLVAEAAEAFVAEAPVKGGQR